MLLVESFLTQNSFLYAYNEKNVNIEFVKGIGFQKIIHYVKENHQFYFICDISKIFNGGIKYNLLDPMNLEFALKIVSLFAHNIQSISSDFNYYIKEL